ncbi:MAG: MFS transporter [Chromatiales bacterium]|nr:MFS transporter [Chromatiales bacterium]
MSAGQQFRLLGQRRFAPYFLTQFLGAFNDNVFKNALIILIAYQQAGLDRTDTNILTNVAAGLFILPFFLFAAGAGQLAERHDKARLIRYIKLAEIGIMSAAALAFWFQSLTGLIVLLFAMGAQSTFFAPIKYGILPQHLRENELVGGNALVQAGTFLAILLGTMLGGMLIAEREGGRLYVATAIVVIAILGYLASRPIPAAPAAAPGLRVNFNPFTAVWENLRLIRRGRSVFLSIMGVSWFWFLGVVYLTQLPNYTQYTLGGDERVVTLLLTLFSVGIGIGSLSCERLSAGRVEIGLVPIGALGLTVFGLDLVFAANAQHGGPLVGAGEFLSRPGSWRVAFDLVAIGTFGGFYIVPLFALVQSRAPEDARARTIAGNTILNAAAMVVASIMAAGLLGAGVTIPQLFGLLAVMNAVVAVFIFMLVPEFTLRAVSWLLVHALYRVRTNGLSRHIPSDGPAMLACNHVSYVDALIIGACVRRPVRFVMYYKIFSTPVLSYLFRAAGAIPIAGRREDEILYNTAFDRIDAALAAGEIVCIFPEGRLTADGEIGEFRPGIERALARRAVPVVPMALRGLWGSLFSRSHGGLFRGGPRKLWARVELIAGPPLPGAGLTVATLESTVRELRGEVR